MKSIISKIFRLPLLVRIIIAIALGISCGFFMPEVIVRVFITFNGLFDQLLKFMIPLIIVGLVTSAIADVGSSAGRLLLITAALAYGSTVLSGLFSFGCSSVVLPSLLSGVSGDELQEGSKGATAFFGILIPPLMDVMTALVTSFLLGLGIAKFNAKMLKECFDELNKIVTLAISKVIIPLLPLYIFGIFLDMTASGSVARILLAFLMVIVFIFILSIILLIAQFTVAGVIVGRNPFKLLWTMLPSYATALGTSSSAATIPVTLQQSQLNGVREEIAGFVVPLCATIHMSGSMLKIVACATTIMMLNGMELSSLQMTGFILMLGITMVASPGVPGGAIMAALGVLESILGFTPEQQAMMITLYIAMDSFGTACNVTGDGAIALIVNKFSKE